VGVTVEEITETPNASYFSPNRRFSPTQRVQFKESLNRFYDGFVERVASGRGVEVEAIEPYCRGRVWTGRKALSLGLVDSLGGLADAVERARELAEISPGDYRRVDILGWSKPTWIREMLRKQVSPMSMGGPEWTVAGWACDDLGQEWRQVEVFRNHQNQPLVMLPYTLRIR
jgi:protease-4